MTTLERYFGTNAVPMYAPRTLNLHEIVSDTQEWRKNAPCMGHDPEWWFADDDTPEQVKALDICESCPFTGQCLAAAQEREGTSSVTARFGIYGGATPTQRFKAAKAEWMRRARAARKEMAA